jgi:hypothetical protein
LRRVEIVHHGLFIRDQRLIWNPSVGVVMRGV